MTADDDDLDDASLKSMRAVWLSMRDEDPPAAGMSGLLAAAREKAESMREPAWWQRMLTQLRRPPALAFATVMLLVGGAMLVTRSADQKVESQTAAVTPADELRSQTAEEVAPAAPVVPEAAPTDRDSAAPVIAQPPAPVRKERAAGRKVKTPPPSDDVGPNEPNRNNRFDGDAAAKQGFVEGKDTATTALESPAAPPPGREATGGAVPTSDSVPEQLARQAEIAAARGDCPAVRTIVGKLKAQDARFYAARLGKHAAVTKCL